MKTDSRMGNEQEDKDALNRIEKLKALQFRLLSPSNNSDSTGTESGYKRRGIVLKHIPHSSVRVAKGFDDTI